MRSREDSSTVAGGMSSYQPSVYRDRRATLAQSSAEFLSNLKFSKTASHLKNVYIDKSFVPGGVEGFSVKEFMYSVIDNCINEKGIGPETLHASIAHLSQLSRGKPVQRLHAWLCKSRRLGAGASLVSTVPSSALKLLPTHLPLPPPGTEGVAPKRARARKNWHARSAAWQMTEWIIASHNYYELSHAKSAKQYQSQLGNWHVSADQHKCVMRE